jgi:hypothetical protein
MKPLWRTIVAIGAVLSVLVFQGMALSAEPSGSKGEASGAKGSSKTLAQTVEEVRNSINEAWQKLTNPKTVEPAREKVNEAWKGLSDAAAAAVGSTNKSQKDTRDKKDK